MIPEDTYIGNLPHKLVRALKPLGAVIAATVVEMCSHEESGKMEISRDYLMGVIGVDAKTLKRQLQKLRVLHIIEYTEGDGRGNFSIFKKGDNYDTLFAIKGDKNTPPYDGKRGTKFPIKGDKNTPLHNIITEIKTAAACARTDAPAGVAAADGERAEIGSPRQAEEKKESKKMVANQFREFWRLFAPAEEFETRKDRCERVFFTMSPDYRQAVLNELRAGAKHRANPLHYLQYYTPADVKPEFPIFRNGMLDLSAAMDEAKKGGRAIACVEAGERLHIPDSHAFVYLDDARAHKLTIKWTIPKEQAQPNNNVK